MADREVATTRIALLELEEERRTAREGYALLDEKRVLLAARALAAIERVNFLRREFESDWHAALEALRSAYDRHGVHALEAWPVVSVPADVPSRDRNVLGIRLPEVVATGDERRTEPVDDGARRPGPVDPSPEAGICAARFAKLLERAAPLAVLETALWRIADEYRRTERRTAAIEHVLLPELDQAIAQVEQALEAVDREEAMRVRRIARRRPPGTSA
jgi:V/A-type H+-transporting ATPase subunit D